MYPELATFITAATPISELRGAIPLGVTLGLDPIRAFLVSVAGNLVVVPILLIIAKPLFERLKTLSKFRGFVESYENKAVEKYHNYRKYRLIGLFLFVAAPIPTTGAYTGCVIAAVLGIGYVNALVAISAGVVVSGIIVTALTGTVVSLL